MNKEIIEIAIELLNTTLGDMPARKADAIVVQVINLLSTIK